MYLGGNNTRRDFLKLAGLAGVAMASLPTPTPDEEHFKRSLSRSWSGAINIPLANIFSNASGVGQTIFPLVKRL